MQLEGKVCVVTGGGRGIGRGITERFLAEGARVAILQRSAVDQELAAREDVLALSVDMTDVAGLPAALGAVADAFGGIDVLVNNAGMMAEHPLEDLTPEAWDRMMAVNTKAPVFLTQAALPHLKARGGGSIVNIGSIEGLGANPGHIAYATAKAAIHGMTRAMAVDLGSDGIRCNAIAPGWIDTDLSDEYLDRGPDPAGARASLDAIHPIGRVGKPQDVGDLAVFLVGDGSSFLTGETIVLDGGRTARLPLPW